VLRNAERTGKRVVGSLLRTVFRSGAESVPEVRNAGSILVVRQHNQLGDMLCAVPLLRALRTQFPSARITLVTSPVNHDVMLHHRCVDETLLFDKSFMTACGLPQPGAIAAFRRALRGARPDWAIVPSTVSTSFTSDMIAWMSGARVRTGCSTLDGRPSPSAFLLTHRVDLDWRASPGRHQAQRTLDIVEGLVSPPVDLASEITLTMEERESGRRLVNREGPGGGAMIAFHPGAGKPPNRWPAERFAGLAELLVSEYGARAFVTAGPMDDEPVARMQEGMHVPCTIVRRKPIREVAALLSWMDLVISNDTGIMHVAAAVGVPVLSLFGPTEPAQWAPTGARHRVLRGEAGNIDALSLEQVLREARTMLRSFPSRVLG
jgi:heptosyltransferase-2